MPAGYLLFGLAWVLSTDRAVEWLASRDPALAATFAGAKGILFLLITTVIFAAWWRIEQRRTDVLLRREEARHLRVRRRLTQHQALLQSIVDANAAPIYVFDLEGRALLINRACAALLGRPRESLIGCSRDEMVSPRDAKAHRNLDLEVIRTGESAITEETLGEGAAQRVFVSVRYPLHDRRGRLYAVGGVSTDITDLRRVQQELREANARLESTVAERTQDLIRARDRALQAARAKSAFLSSVSHELRTPLNAILGFTDVVLHGLSGPLNVEQERHLHLVHDSAHLLLDLINEILDMARIEAGRLELDRSSFELKKVLEARVSTIRPAALAKGLAVTLGVDPSAGRLLSDEKRVGQIVAALLSNAVKFTAQGRVRVRAGGDEAEVWVEVSDTGPGIAASNLERVFQPFVQVEGPQNACPGGTGIGLAIARHVARALGGDLSARSEPGAGSTFRVTVPRRAPEEAEVSNTGLFQALSG